MCSPASFSPSSCELAHLQRAYAPGCTALCQKSSYTGCAPANRALLSVRPPPQPGPAVASAGKEILLIGSVLHLQSSYVTWYQLIKWYLGPTWPTSLSSAQSPEREEACWWSSSSDLSIFMYMILDNTTICLTLRSQLFPLPLRKPLEWCFSYSLCRHLILWELVKI